ncbi:MAG: hypothetical protein JJE04_13260 [Acidobacteriia bacterium]|nr:hypothetical protein [Terriglobia bacterium]
MRKTAPTVVWEGDGAQSPSPDAIHPILTGATELSSILVTGRSIEELSARAVEAIRIYWECTRSERSSNF